MKKIFICLIILFSFFSSSTVVYADDFSEKDNPTSIIEEMIEDIDLSELEELLNQTHESTVNVKEIILKAIKGDYLSLSSVFEAIFKLLKENFATYAKTFTSIFSVLIVCGLFSTLKPDKCQTNEIVFIVCYITVLLLIFSECTSAIDYTTQIITNLSKQTENLFPVLLTLLSVTGSNASTSVYTPTLVFATSGILSIVTKILLPLVSICTVLSVISSFSDRFSLNKVHEFFKDIYRWIIGGVITVFSVFSSIKGITTNAYDNFSLRTLKYMVGNSFPLIGSFAKEGVDVVLSTTILIKNAIGSVAIFAIFFILLTPFLKIAILSLGLKFLSAIVEPIADIKISLLLNSFSKTVTMLASLLL
ncbi:MAG: stage III sporulation protein AE, partial [Clostridia bacterium]|nr:stage III sporulation protein AE [Clostridia bacterium]